MSAGELLERLVEVLEQETGDEERARSALIEALVLDPGNERLAHRLRDGLRREDGRWEGLVEAIEVAIRRKQDLGTKTKLAEWVVRWARSDARDAATANRFVTMIRSFDSTHPLVHERMAEAYAQVGAWDSRRQELERALARADKPADRSALHVALGELFEVRLPNAKLALEHFEKAARIESAIAHRPRRARTHLP